MKILSMRTVYLVIQCLLLSGVFPLSISILNESVPLDASNRDDNVTEFSSMTTRTFLMDATSPDYNESISKQIKPLSDIDSTSVTTQTENRFTKYHKEGRRFNFLLFHILRNSSQNLNSSTSQLNNTSLTDISSEVLKNVTYYDLCDILHIKEDCMQSSIVKEIQSNFKTRDTNVTDSTLSTDHPTDVESCSNDTWCILTQHFHCDIEIENELNISCVNVDDIYSIGKYLPNFTAALDISYSYQVKLLTPLIPHLKSLKSLTLTNNHHRYITKAFIGLINLERLDLSNNDILGLVASTFSVIPKLNVLNLSSNRVRKVMIVSNAVSSLKNLQELRLEHNTIRYILKQDLLNFMNCSIEVLSLFNTTINFVERGAFNFLPRLKILDISVNYIDEYALANLTCSITNTIEVLYFRMMLGIKSLPYDALQCLTNTKLKELYLGNNYINVITRFPSLPNLRKLSLSNGTTQYIEKNAFDNITNLECLQLSSNKLIGFPETLSSVKSIKKLYLDSQDMGIISKFTINDYAFMHLVNLETVSLSLLPLEKVSRYTLYGLKNLDTCSLPFAGLLNIEDRAFETHKSVTILDLRGNGLASLSNFTFYGLENLKYLLLTGNKISSLSYPFQYSPLIRMLFLQSNVIGTIPEGVFANLKNLVVLSLKANKIIPWKKRIFHPNVSLGHLELPENNIDYISDCMLSEFHQIKYSLDLSKNPFNCSKCGMKEFQTFLKNSNLSSKLFHPKEKYFNYVCLNPESLRNETFVEIDLPDDLCLDIVLGVLSLIAIIMICLVFISIIFILSLCYLFRWYVRYGIFRFKTTLGYSKIIERNKTYQYDAFIIFCATDTTWVQNHLMPTLEEQEPSYKLCVHERDFIAGIKIDENILRAVDNSHKVIIILTEDFLKSEWCMYELHIAQHKLFGDARDILILVKLGAIDKKLYSKNMSYIKKTRKCLTWSNNPMGQKLFWEEMRKELGPSRVVQNLISL